MGKIGLAFRVFWRTLRDRSVADRVERLLRNDTFPPLEDKRPTAPEPAKREPAKKPPARSDAVSLLATLQREARFIDFVKEPISAYSDAQIGAAVRDVHRDCAAVFDRLFGLAPLLEHSEGADIEVPAGFDAGKYRLTGNVSGQPPFRGRLAHHGWMATRCELPAWTGAESAVLVVAPAEVELR